MMIIEFPGTKGEIEESSIKHRYHSSLIVKYKNTSILIDLGLKFNPVILKEIDGFNFILITHAHPDHYIWTVEERNDINNLVYLTRDTLDYGKYKPKNYRIIESGRNYRLEDLKIRAYRLLHSLRCPAVGYNITGDKKIIYAPDILDFEEDKQIVLKDIDLLIADGSSINANLVRRKDGKIFGHTRVKTIAGWCRKYGVKNLVITHCGKQIVTMDKSELDYNIREYSEGEINIAVAHDGYSMKL